MSDYRPIVCGDCKYFVEMGKRSDETHGAQPGVCTKLMWDVCRTDWCMDPRQVEMHKIAMAEYKGEKE